MAKTYAQIVAGASARVQDSGNAVFATTEFDTLMPSGLTRVSQAIPWEYRLTKQTVASTRNITLTSGDKWRLLPNSGYKGTGIDRLEYTVDQYPPNNRGLTRFGDIITIEKNSAPSAAEDIYFFFNKVHLLQKAIGTTDTALAIKTQGEIGDTSLALKSAGTVTVNEMTTIAITGDSTIYYVITDATIAANEVTVSIWPALVAVAAVDTVVTLSLTSSSMDMVCEDYLERWLSAQASISKSTLYYQQLNTAITTIANAATAIGAIAAMITTALASSTSGKAQAALGATAVILANAEYDKMVTAIELQKTAVASGLALANTIPVGGGLGDYLATANGDASEAQARMLNGQAYLQEASADHSNAAQYYSAAAAELRAAGEKAQEANANLSLVATRMRVSDNGRNYENWGRLELAKVEQELNALNGFPHSVQYPRD